MPYREGRMTNLAQQGLPRPCKRIDSASFSCLFFLKFAPMGRPPCLPSCRALDIQDKQTGQARGPAPTMRRPNTFMTSAWLFD